MGKTVAVCYGGIEIMYPTVFPILEGEKVQRILSSDFLTHLDPLQKHSLVVRHFTHSDDTDTTYIYLCEGSRRKERGKTKGRKKRKGRKRE